MFKGVLQLKGMNLLANLGQWDPCRWSIAFLAHLAEVNTRSESMKEQESKVDLYTSTL